ncbi:hypothetical protein F5X96DRAFT_664784, partial [Biscogniauxia mediterranea]
MWVLFLFFFPFLSPVRQQIPMHLPTTYTRLTTLYIRYATYRLVGAKQRAYLLRENGEEESKTWSRLRRTEGAIDKTVTGEKNKLKQDRQGKTGAQGTRRGGLCCY